MATIRVKTDYPTIQAAVDAALPGDEILVEDGVYHEQVTVGKSFIKITGGEKTVLDGELKYGAGFSMTNVNEVEICSFTIKNFENCGIQISGNSNNNAVLNTEVLDAGIYGISIAFAAINTRVAGCSVSGAHVGVINYGSNLCLEDCRISYNGDAGTDVFGSNVDIKNCTIHDNYAAGITIHGEDVRVAGCKINNNVSYGVYSMQSGCRITGNEISGNRIEGIHLESAGSVVLENQVKLNGRNGIYVGGTGFHTVTDNEVSGNGTTGVLIWASANTIEGNKALENGRFDIVRQRADNTVQKNICGKSIPPSLCSCAMGNEDKMPNEAVGCGPDAIRVPKDYPTIQAAVDAALPGDMILVEDGVYSEQVVVGTGFIKIIGVGRPVLDGGMKLDTAFVLNNTSGVEIRSFIVKNYRSDGIDFLGNANGNWVADTWIYDINYFGVWVSINAMNNRITGCSIQGAYYGVYICGSGFVVKDCVIAYNGYYGVFLSSDSGNTDISGCIICCNYSTGIYSRSGSARISANRVYENMMYGIYFSSNALVERNRVYKNTFDGICFENSNSVIKENWIWSNEESGIQSGSAWNTIIQNNIFENKKYGILLNSKKNIVRDNIVRGNALYDIVRRCADCVVENNDCGKSFPPGICEKCALTECETANQEDLYETES